MTRRNDAFAERANAVDATTEDLLAAFEKRLDASASPGLPASIEAEHERESDQQERHTRRNRQQASDDADKAKQDASERQHDALPQRSPGRGRVERVHVALVSAASLQQLWKRPFIIRVYISSLRMLSVSLIMMHMVV